MESFLSSLDLPSTGEQQSAQLVAEISVEELDRAISKLKVNKALGSDGYPYEWY